MKRDLHLLGIDIGSVSIAMAELSLDKKVIATQYQFHHGLVKEHLLSLLNKFNLKNLGWIAVTSGSPQILKGVTDFDDQIALISGVKTFYKDIGSLLFVGGERFGLIHFNADGSYRKLNRNSSCAAGTGSFLDQQALRLNLQSSGELGEIALKNQGALPKIASRCSVFAKTDLIHIQQQGYGLEEICDGLCSGLAKNIADTLVHTEPPREPLIFLGGVSRNRAVVKHLEKLIRATIFVDENSHLYGAIGAGLLKAEQILGQNKGRELFIKRGEELLLAQEREKQYFHAPLTLTLSQYPEFKSEKRYLFHASVLDQENPVEVDVYRSCEKGSCADVYLGIDIGSTSTKAVLMDPGEKVLAGFYTRTAGQPLKAVQALFEALDNLRKKKKLTFNFLGVGTTGSGRKFIGQVLGADLIIDEITAHAQAACHLDPQIDTIIEIGGQDAKFTTLRDGTVTFSQMNTVCAAGTGSFIEEQAAKLGVPLSQYANRAQNVWAPLASDRCTVFMERDINHYLNQNYTVDEILAATLHSVRANYLLKVATESAIGKRVCFQGATAKNRALVAAFEEKLQQPIFVSEYCHLTGALGCALILAEEKHQKSSFRGIGIYKEQIPIRTEVCSLCNNHCRILLTDFGAETVAYGFLCGRDYHVKKYINKNSSGFDLLKARRKVLFPHHPESPLPLLRKQEHRKLSVGIPKALHLFDELPLWELFFRQLGIRVVTSDNLTEPVTTGKQLAAAEFCAPMAAFHGHALYLKDKCDYLFIPFYFEATTSALDKKRKRNRSYCYYTQFSSALVANLENVTGKDKIILPLINYSQSILKTKLELLKSLQPVCGKSLNIVDISLAYDRALSEHEGRKYRLQELYKKEEKRARDVSVVLLGRPYTILAPAMNKGIPEIFGTLGVKTYFQDMIPISKDKVEEVDPLLDIMYWHFAANILKTAALSAQTENLYPVLVTSFKCSPDSFMIEYFKNIMEHHQKPYLILQIDEHDSNMGYETRIESAVRAFRNHHGNQAKKGDIRAVPMAVPQLAGKLAGKTVLFPHWDPITSPLLTANLRREGFDARLLEEDQQKIHNSMRMNSGQCIPVNVITQEVADYIQKYRLDPAQTVLWMIDLKLACNIPLYPHYIKKLLEDYGEGLEKVEVFAGNLTHIDISPRTTVNAYFCYMFGGLLRRLGCRIRPYEKFKGETNQAIGAGRAILEHAFSTGASLEEALVRIFDLFNGIAVEKATRPQVAIFGDLYVRDNDVMNENLILDIEAAGGEVITTPYNEYVKIIVDGMFKRWLKHGHFLDFLKNRSLLAAVEMVEKKYYQLFKPYLGRPKSFDNPYLEDSLKEFNLKLEHEGESFDNVLKILHLLKEYPSISLFVQTNPAFCCPSLITEAMADKIERVTGVPIVTITYDGTAGRKNDIIRPYIRYAKQRGDHGVGEAKKSLGA